ncbi:CDP-diacylglycerol--glycerol-3-phosphate 3-phosphatidyltransferase, partial [Mycoplasma sp. 2575]
MKKIKDIKKSKNNSPHIKKFGIANWLTVLRIILMIPFIFLMSSAFFLIIKHNGTFWYDGIKIVGNQKYSITLSIIYWLNVSIFIIAMVTDFIDGHIARKTKTISQFGKIFDPIADKIATIMMLLFISIMNYSFLPIVVLFIIRDILVDGARVYAVKKDIKVAANWWGKIKTIIVSLAIITIAFSAPWFTNFDNDLGKYVSNDKYILYVNIPLIVGLILSWISGIIYLVKYLKGITKQYLEDISKKNNDDIKNP